VAEETVRKAEKLKEVMFEISYDLDRFEAALSRLASAVGETKQEIVKASAALYDYVELHNRLTWYAQQLDRLARECKAVADLIHSKLEVDQLEKLKRKPALRLVYYALKEGHRTVAAVRSFLEREGVYVSEHAVKERLKELVKLGLVVKEEGGYYFPVEDLLKRWERG